MFKTRLFLVDDGGGEALDVLDVDSLDVAVQLLGGILRVIAFPGNADAESVWHTLDAPLPDLLVECRVDADILGAL